jgi:cytochrome c oxidase subunit III
MSARAVAAQASVSVEARALTVALGMWVFLATEVMFFAALFLAYLHARLHDPAGFAAASHHTHEWLGTVNTAILLTSSLTMALAVRASRLGERKPLVRLLAATALMGAAFMVVKGTEYFLEWQDGLVPHLHFTYAGAHARAVQTFFYLYFVMTGVHAVHLAIGIALVAWLAWRAHRAPVPPEQRATIDSLGLYWHFVDAVWIFLYPLFYLVELYR